MKTDERSYEYPTNYRRGSANPAARLNEEQVREIKALLARGAGYRFLARRYGVSRQTIRAIATGQSWRCVPDPSGLPRVVQKRGPRNRLDEQLVRAIRRSAAQGVSRRELAQRYGVCLTTIGLIVRRDTWKKLSDDD